MGRSALESGMPTRRWGTRRWGRTKLTKCSSLENRQKTVCNWP